MQGDHGRQQRVIAGWGQLGQFVPLRLGLLQHFNFADIAHLIHAGQADGHAFFIGPPGAANAVDVDFCVGRHVNINNHSKLGNVQAACSHVRSHQHRTAAVGKLHQHLVALALLQLAKQRQRAKPLVFQIRHQRAALRLGVAKRQRAGGPEVPEHLRYRTQPRLVVVAVWHLIPALGDFCFFVLRLHGDGLRRFHELCRQLGNAFGIGG